MSHHLARSAIDIVLPDGSLQHIELPTAYERLVDKVVRFVDSDDREMVIHDDELAGLSPSEAFRFSVVMTRRCLAGEFVVERRPQAMLQTVRKAKP